MNTQWLQQRLDEQIPLTRALQARVVRASEDEVVVSAPLEPNHNHQCTVFGGSLYCAGVLAAWGLASIWLKAEECPGEVVIQSGEMAYILPADDDVIARVCPDDTGQRQRLRRMLERHGRGRIRLEGELHSRGRLCARFTGRFVVKAAR